MNEDRRIEKRSRILDAAGELFLNQGVDKTKIIDIARSAGVAKGTVYEYFDSKEAIAVEWVRGMFIDFRERMTDIKESRKCFKDKLSDYFDCCFEQLSQVMLKSKMIIGSSAESTDTAGPRTHPDPERLKKCMESQSLQSVIMDNAFFEVNILKDLLKEAIEKGEIRRDVNISLVATYILSTIPFMGFMKTHSPHNEFLMKDLGLDGINITGRDLADLVVDGTGL